MTTYAAPQLVNGTLCYNCDQVDRANAAKKLGVPTDDVTPTGTLKSGVKKNGAAASSTSATQTPGVNQPLSSGNRGTTLNMVA